MIPFSITGHAVAEIVDQGDAEEDESSDDE